MNEGVDRKTFVNGFFAGILGAVLVLVIAQKTAPATFLNENFTGTPVTADEERIVGVIERANPAVVSIVISKELPVRNREFGNLFYDPFFFPLEFGSGSVETRKREIGGGSGFFVSSDGLIVTNRHVVNDQTATYTVYTNDGKSYPASVVARDSALDIALIKVRGSGFSYLTFADSEQVKVGQTVIAIGNALSEFRNTVSVGVVSGLARSIIAGSEFGQTERLDEVIQTDAAINPGNSGGPLLDLSGKVIGVNVAVAEESENIGFALPAGAVRDVVESVQKTGRIIHPFLGIRYIPVTKAIAEEEKLAVDYGVLVVSGQGGENAIVPGSPADKAGIAEGDVIVQFNGKKLTEGVSLASEIRRSKVGAQVRLVLVRGASTRTVTATLVEAPQ